MENRQIEKAETEIKGKTKGKGKGWGIAIPFLILFIAGGLLLGYNSIQKAAVIAKDAYDRKVESVSREKYDQYYESAFDAAEERYHVENKVTVTVGPLQEEAKLEVLEVNDVEYSIFDPEKSGAELTSWLEIPGKCVFTVDLSLAESVIENERNYVLIRVPSPEVSDCTVDYENVKPLYWDEGFRNYSYREGEEIAQEQLKEGYMEIRNYVLSNQKFYGSAKAAAESMITYLVRQMNPEIPDLTVEVEFIS